MSASVQWLPAFSATARHCGWAPADCGAHEQASPEIHLYGDLLSEAHRPALFHCTTGKDRTGWAAAALLTLLGVPDEMVMHEFLVTNEQLVPALQPVLDRFQSQGGDPELLLPIIGVQEEYLEAAFDKMCKHFGTIEGYFAEGLGIDAKNQLALRTAFCIRVEIHIAARAVLSWAAQVLPTIARCRTAKIFSPRRLMLPEMKYPKTLQSAASYEVQAGDLTLFDGNDTKAVTYQRMR